MSEGNFIKHCSNEATMKIAENNNMWLKNLVNIKKYFMIYDPWFWELDVLEITV